MRAYISDPAAQLAGTISEAILYGIYLITSVYCAQTLLLVDGRWVRLHEVRWLMSGIWIIFFLVSTLDLAFGTLLLFRAFIDADDATAEIDQVRSWMNIGRAINRSISILLGDFVLIYRCWIVYERRWRVITPSLLLYLGVIVISIKLLEIQISSHTYDQFKTAIRPWFTTMFGISAIQTILNTSMLVWRIWHVVKDVDRHYPSGFSEYRQRPLRTVMRVVAESGMVYTTMVLITFFFQAFGLGAISVMGAKMTLQMAGIVFNFILVRSKESNSRELPARAARTGSGRITPTFLPAARDTSVDPERL